jgi:hypothetical protein
LLQRAAKLMVKVGYRSYSVTVEVAGKEKRYGFMESGFYLDMIKIETRRRSDRRAPLAPLAPHQPCAAHDAADALERGGMVSGPGRIRDGRSRFGARSDAPE